jgi:hypothetical protein
VVAKDTAAAYVHIATDTSTILQPTPAGRTYVTKLILAAVFYLIICLPNLYRWLVVVLII